MNERVTLFGAIGGAILASVCCIGPVVLAGLSVGAVAAAQSLASWRPVFLALTTIFLGAGFYFTYRKPRQEACTGEACEVPGLARWSRLVLWVVTIVVLVLVTFPYYYGPLRGALDKPAKVVGRASASPQLAKAELEITGMSCEGCAVVVKNKLLETAGVAEAEVDYPAGRARVKYDPAKTATSKLIEAVNSAGYRASLPGAAGK